MTRHAAPAPASVSGPVLPRARLADRIKVSPIAARIAEAKFIDREGITVTGPNGRIVRADLDLPPVVAPAPAQTAGTGSAAPIVHDIPDVPHALETLSNMRRPIARRMNESKQPMQHISLTLNITLQVMPNLRVQLNEKPPPPRVKQSHKDQAHKLPEQ